MRVLDIRFSFLLFFSEPFFCGWEVTAEVHPLTRAQKSSCRAVFSASQGTRQRTEHDSRDDRHCEHLRSAIWAICPRRRPAEFEFASFYFDNRRGRRLVDFGEH